jgi:hypothetical protein
LFDLAGVERFRPFAPAKVFIHAFTSCKKLAVEYFRPMNNPFTESPLNDLNQQEIYEREKRMNALTSTLILAAGGESRLHWDSLCKMYTQNI